MLTHITNPHHDAEHNCPTQSTNTRQAAEDGIEYGLRKGQSLVGKYPKRGEDAIKFGVWHCTTAFGAKSKCAEGVCRLQYENMGHKSMTCGEKMEDYRQKAAFF